MGGLTSPTGLAANLGSTQPFQGDPNTGVSATPAIPIAAPAAPASAPPDAPHTFGKAVGKIFSGLGESHEEYSIDPQTGQQTVTSVKNSPGQWARGILAAGLLGSEGIGPREGQQTFAQGLIAGLSGGTRAAAQQRTQADEQKRRQAQEDYANQLKAAENQRQNKELDMREQLNKVAIARDNAVIAVQNRLLHESLKGEEGAANQLEIDASKDKVQDYKDAESKPVKEGLTLGELNQFVPDNKGASANYQGLPTGQKNIKGADGAYHPVTTYSVYNPITTVSDGLISRMKEAGLDKTYPSLFKEMSVAAGYDPKTGKFSGVKAPTDYTKISLANQETAKQIGYQDLLDKHRTAVSEQNRNAQEGAAAVMRLKNESYDYEKKVKEDHTDQVFNERFNPSTGAVDLNGLEDTKDAKGKLVPNKDRTALIGRLNQLNQYYSGELFKYEKKDENGGYSISDPAAVGIANSQRAIQKGLSILQGNTQQQPPPNGQSQSASEVQGLQAQVISQAPPQLASAVQYFISSRTIPGPVGKDGKATSITIPAPQSLNEALQSLDVNQKDPAKRLSPEDYKSLVDLLTTYYQNIGPLQQKVEAKTKAEDLENRYIKLHALNPFITKENQSQFDDSGRLTIDPLIDPLSELYTGETYERYTGGTYF